MPDLYYEPDFPGDLPVAVMLKTCDFPIVEANVDGYRTLVLPESIRRHFESGASVVRVSSKTIAETIPDFGGKASGEYSLLPHQDHLDPCGDLRRYLMLSKTEDGARGSSTLVMGPSTASKLLPRAEAFFKECVRRTALREEREYDARFLISEEEYRQCFDTDSGYERVVARLIAEGKNELSVRLGILGYLVRGPSADTLMEELATHCRKACVEERWEECGVVILDNARVFHARLGGNVPPLKRNFLI